MSQQKTFIQWLLLSGRIALLSLAASLLGACALTPNKEEAKKQSDALLQSQLQHVETQLKKPHAGPYKHIYLGSAQHSQSLVFQRDILAMESRLKTLNTNTVSILLSNQFETQQLQFPFATRPNLDRVFGRLSAWSHSHPLALTMLVSTHGAPDILSVNIGNQYYQPLRSAQLKS